MSPKSSTEHTSGSLDASVAVGPMLVGSARLALRHWLLGLVGILGMAGMMLLLLDLAGRCFGAGHAACISPALFDALGGQKQPFIGDLIVLVPLGGAFVVGAIMLRLFYLAEPGDAHATRTTGLRLCWFIGRLAVAWLIVAAPELLLDSAYRHAAWLLYPDYGTVALWLGYLVVEVLRLSVATYLHARILLYLPSVTYQDLPDSLPALWTRTRPVGWRLFFVFFPIDVGTTVVQTVFGWLAPAAFDFGAIAAGLADWSRADLQYVTALLPSAIIYAIVFPLNALWNAGVSVLAYRKLVAIDHARAGVFD